MAKPNPEVLRHVLLVLPSAGEITSFDLRHALGIRVSNHAVARVLRHLIAEGRATFEGEMGKRRYRWLPPQTSEVA